MNFPFTRIVSARGFYLPFLALLIVALCALIGLAVDGGNLFLHQLRLQNAVDAATLNAVPYLSRMNNESLTANVRTSVIGQMQESGSRILERDIDVTIPVARNRIDVDARLNVPLYFMSVFPGVGTERPAAANAAAGRNPLALSVLIDNSFSMEAYTPCSPESLATLPRWCRDVIPDSPPRCRKKCVAAGLALTLVDLFDQGGLDWLGIALFNSEIQEILPLSNTFSSDDLAADIEAALRRPAFDTALHSALAWGIAQLESPAAGLPAESQRRILLLTDGAPRLPNTIGDSFCGYSNDPLEVERRDFAATLIESYRAKTTGIPVDVVAMGAVLDSAAIAASFPGAAVNEYNHVGRDGYLFTLAENLLRQIANVGTIAQYQPQPGPPAVNGLYAAAPAFAMPDESRCTAGAGSPPLECGCVTRVGIEYPRGLYLVSTEATTIVESINDLLSRARKPRLLE